MLQCPHFHVVFTVPHELLGVWRYNRQRLASVLFRSASVSVTGLLEDPKYMGGAPGILGVLHTWGGMLNLHPHVHLLVSLVGLSPAGEMVKARWLLLLPFRVLRKRFHDVFLDQLTKLFETGELYLPRDTHKGDFRRLLEKMRRRPPKRYFNVRVMRRDDYHPVLKYLARTVCGGPIANRNLLSVDPTGVRFRYRSWHGVEAGMGARDAEGNLGVQVFVSRWMEHVPQHGMQTVRNYGIYSNRQQRDLIRLHQLLGDEYQLDGAGRGNGDPNPVAESGHRCHICGASMVGRKLAPTPHPILLIEAGEWSPVRDQEWNRGPPLWATG